MFQFLERYLWWSAMLAFVTALLGLSGCMVDGNRALTFTVGTTVSIEDQAKPNSKGDTEYHVGLDADGRSLLDAIIGSAQDAKDEEPDPAPNP